MEHPDRTVGNTLLPKHRQPPTKINNTPTTDPHRWIRAYLGFAASKLADFENSLCQWRPDAGKEQVGHLFARQAIPMVWDYTEASPFTQAAGGWDQTLLFIPKTLDRLPQKQFGYATQANSADRTYPKRMTVSTDPPYYDNIGYADLSDFFYVWLRRSLGTIHGDVTSTMLTPKTEELVATPYRFDGSQQKARQHFESGFNQTFVAIRRSQDGTFPMTLFYAFKQSESDEGGIASTGWETMLTGLIESGFAVTATWPMRSELSNRMLASGTNALASSIVLACRPREVTAQTVMRSGFVAALQAELPWRLRNLQQGAIAPVDLPQAAIGPGMAIFSRYELVLESDGSPMPVRTALQLINQVLDGVLYEQEGDFDADTRWCVRWFEQHGFANGVYGEAETLATARNISVDGLDHAGVLRQGGNRVTLLGFDDLDPGYDPTRDDRPTVWEGTLHTAARLKNVGIDDAARFLQRASSRIDLEAVKQLGYVLFSICDRKKQTESARIFNGLVTSWLDLQDAMRTLPAEVLGQLPFDEEV